MKTIGKINGRDQMTDQSSNSVELPEPLKQQINVFERRLRFMETVVAVAGGLCGLLGTYALVFLSDRLWDTPAMLRGILALTGFAAFVAFAWFWFRHWLWHRRSTRDLARLVQRAYRRLGDRLLGAVELAGDGRITDQNISPALCRAAIRQVAAEAEKYDFGGAVSIKQPRLAVILFSTLALLVGISAALFPQAGWNALMRWFNPIGEVERFTFVRLEDMPPIQRVPHGEPFEIVVRLDHDSRWTPENATCRFEDQPRITARLRDGRAMFSVPGQTRQGDLTIRIGDVTRRITIVPTHRSELVRMRAAVELPGYLQLDPVDMLVRGGRADFVHGSRVLITGEVGRELSSASWHHDGEQMVLEVREHRFSTPPLEVESLSRHQFAWLDQYELEGAAPYELTIAAVEDQAPQVFGEGIPRAVAVLENEVLHLNIRARDDFGVRRVMAEWLSENDEERGYAPMSRRVVLAEGSPDDEEISATYAFSPALESIPQETLILLRAAATDYKPDREPSYSGWFQIYVLSKTAHAELLRAEMQRIQDRIADIANEEERLLTANIDLFKLSDDELATDATQAALDDHQRAEERNIEQAMRAAERIGELAREALRNPDMDMQTVQDWVELSDMLRQIARQEMRQAAQSLGEAADSPQERRGELEEAIRQEQQALEQLRQILEQMDRSLEQVAARNFINRLRQVAEWKEELANEIKALLPHVIGMRVEELAPEHSMVLNRMVVRQQENSRQAGFIHDDLGGFFRISGGEIYGFIHDEMNELLMRERLSLLGERIGRNETTGAVDEAMIWHEQFNAWADLLEDADDGHSDCDSEGDGEEIDIELLLALIRTRIAQENVREQTRMLEEGRETNAYYPTDADRLAGRQKAITEILEPFMETISIPQVAELAAEVRRLIFHAGELIDRPQTDSETIAVQTMVIELLAQAIESAMQGSGDSSGAMQMMVMLGQHPGQQPGRGSYAGGQPDRESGELSGRADEATNEDRTVESAGGVSTAALPEEFREMLEAYFEQVEGL